MLFLPPVAWLPDQHSHQQDISPDTAELFRLLAAEGITSHIFDPLQRPWNPLARCHPLLRSIDPLRALYVLLRYRRVDTVVCVFEGSALLLALLRRACRFRPRLLMWDIGLTESWRLRRWLQNLLVPRLDEILVLGTNQVGEISARWPRHAAVTCIGHYTDTTFFRPLPPSEGSDGYVLAVGDDEGRDYPTLLAAVAGLAADCVVRTHQLLPLDPVRDARVRPIVERLSFPALRELYADAAVIVVPLAERPRAGGVTAVLEAAAMGRAAVVSASSGVRDWCRDGETCLMVPCGDAAAMRAAIQRLLEDTELRTRLGRNARTFAENECSTAAFAVRLARRL